MKIAVCMPSRGLIHSRTIEHVLRETQSAPAQYFYLFTHDKPIPDCFNDLVKRALDHEADYIWFVEEDMKLPEGVLRAMLDRHKPIVTVDYPVGKSNTVKIENNEVVFCGTGCLLVKSEVFKGLEPYFRADIEYILPDYTPTPSKHGYGKQDIDFCIRVRELGYKIHLLEKPAGQYRIAELGEAGVNDGCHKVVEWN